VLSEKIKLLRTSQGLTQTEFAKRLFVTPGAVYQWETGRTAPDTSRLIAIAKEFSIPLDFFNDEPYDKKYTEAELIEQQLLLKLGATQPQTSEARILAKGVDKLPKAQREQALNVVKAMFSQYSDYFKESDNDPEL